MQAKKGSTLNATFLVAGTCIGGGILALPVATGQAGFFPSAFFMFIGWAFMTMTALYLAEINSWMDEGAHFVTMASRLLGPIGRIAAWLLYLFICYASLVAYTAAGGDLFLTAIRKLFDYTLDHSLAVSIFALIFGFIIYLGNVVVGRINTLLVVGLILSYLLLVVMGSSAIEWVNLLRNEWGSTLIAMPLLLTIFSFQTIVPSLSLYLHKDVRALKISIVAGTSIAFGIYLVWQALVLGTLLLDGDYGLARALAMGKPATDFLGVALNRPFLQTLADFFAFFAIVTSFLGIGLGLFDFLADSLKIRPQKSGKLVLIGLVVLPTLFFVLIMERIFLRALDASGGIGDSLLNGLMPALMVWIGRYVQGRGSSSEFRVFGGKPLLLFVMAWSLFVLSIELLGIFGFTRLLGA